jgi:hypothetical protein
VSCRRVVAGMVAQVVMCAAGVACDATAPATPAVFVSPARLSLQDGDTARLEAKLRNPKSRHVTWSSSNAAVARVDIAGLVTAVTNGSATITAKMEDDTTKTASADVTVSGPAVVTVDVSPTAGTVYVGRSSRLTVVLRASDGRVVRGRSITWSSPDPAIADVSSTGLVTGRGPGGPISVVATAEGHTGTARIRVAHAAEQCPTIVKLTLGQPVSGALAAGDCEVTLDASLVDVYEVSLTSQSTLQIDLVSADFDAYLGLFDANGQLVAQDDNSGGGTHARVVMSVAPGTYRIWANSRLSGQTGSYALTAKTITH